MPQHISNQPVCHHCDGFPVVAITTGARHRDGSRVTIRVTCRDCRGTGHTAPAPVMAHTGR